MVLTSFSSYQLPRFISTQLKKGSLGILPPFFMHFFPYPVSVSSFFWFVQTVSSGGLHSCTEVPLPLAIRRLRLPFKTARGSRRSSGVMERIMALINKFLHPPVCPSAFSTRAGRESFPKPVPGVPSFLTFEDLLQKVVQGVNSMDQFSSASWPSARHEVFLGFFNKGKHIAHTQDPLSHPVGMEGF